MILYLLGPLFSVYGVTLSIGTPISSVVVITTTVVYLMMSLLL